MAELVWDKRAQYVYQQIEPSRFSVLYKRYTDFLAVLNDVNTEPVRVYDPIDEKKAEELQLIREVSRTLQKKKEDDINKAKADAEAAVEVAAEDKEDTKEENVKEVTGSEEKTEGVPQISLVPTPEK